MKIKNIEPSTLQASDFSVTLNFFLQLIYFLLIDFSTNLYSPSYDRTANIHTQNIENTWMRVKRKQKDRVVFNEVF